MIRVRLVRHAHAEPRAAHHGSDAARPLDQRGRRQAAAVATSLADHDVRAITGVRSSPAVRCVATVEPIAQRAGLPVAIEDRLAEGSPAGHVFGMLGELDGDTVLCSHGDVIGDVVFTLIGRGLILTGRADWAKASTWVLDVEHGEVIAASYEAPPD